MIVINQPGLVNLHILLIILNVFTNFLFFFCEVCNLELMCIVLLCFLSFPVIDICGEINK